MDKTHSYQRLKSVDELEALYGIKSKASDLKVARMITPLYGQWIEAAKFCLIATVGPEGTDVAPRGDDGPVVKILTSQLLAMPDWRGNNRLDTLRNIVRDPRVSLLFMVPGVTNVVRLNGRSSISTDTSLIEQFKEGDRLPKTVVLFDVEQVYFQCARALMRSQLWVPGAEESKLPTPGQLLKEQSDGHFDGQEYDEAWFGRAQKTLW